MSISSVTLYSALYHWSLLYDAGMSELEGKKRLQPKMTRGSWRLSIWLSGLQVLCFSVLAFSKLNTGNG
ncbi:hypothetical protein SAMN04489740_4052 [Arthrobacter alpinus]|uniref:Uncharacterized protein n=1 Tax=Arthrobacter alpinus TaxID=656366 RepID=A0A1H5PAP9_9MICC|nr:hypothetical protein [Arthrobacter alpinus]SEF10949.1 hypothetical protein SAMN04489740_4052 [Arthrobacter alpinus]